MDKKSKKLRDIRRQEEEDSRQPIFPDGLGFRTDELLSIPPRIGQPIFNNEPEYYGMGPSKMAAERRRSQALKNRLQADGFVVDIFESEPEVLSAVINDHGLINIEGSSVLIAKKLKYEKYKFVVVGSEDTKLCDALRKQYELGKRDGRPLNAETIKRGEEVRVKNADDHAINMYQIVQNSKEITAATSLRGIAKILNEQGIPTARGKKWAPETVRILVQRWDDLGIKSNLKLD